MVVGLQQRLLSSIEAFARSLKKHRETVQRHWDKAHEPESDPHPALYPDDELAPDFLMPADADDERAGWTSDEADADEEAQIAADRRRLPAGCRPRNGRLGPRTAPPGPDGGRSQRTPDISPTLRRSISSNGSDGTSARGCPPSASPRPDRRRRGPSAGC